MKAILKYTRIHLYQSNVNLIVCNLRDSPILNDDDGTLSSSASPLLGSPLGRSRQSSSQSDLSGPPANSSSSGLSFTACMSDFSLYVFHPYGAGKQKPNMTGLPSGPGNLGTVSLL